MDALAILTAYVVLAVSLIIFSIQGCRRGGKLQFFSAFVSIILFAGAYVLSFIVSNAIVGISRVNEWIDGLIGNTQLFVKSAMTPVLWLVIFVIFEIIYSIIVNASKRARVNRIYNREKDFSKLPKNKSYSDILNSENQVYTKQKIKEELFYHSSTSKKLGFILGAFTGLLFAFIVLVILGTLTGIESERFPFIGNVWNSSVFGLIDNNLIDGKVLPFVLTYGKTLLGLV